MAGNPILDRRFRNVDGERVLPPLPPGVAPGNLVAVRGGRWRVAAAVAHADCRELHLRGASGETRVLLWPFDRPAAVAAPPRLRRTPLRRWARGAARALSQSRDPWMPRGRFTGDVLPYQLEPAVAVAAGVARVLLADEVGLGKTVQAGWILADLLAREPGARALVAVPASLREQWVSELDSLFCLAATRVDAAWLRAAVADRAADVSPWAAPGIYIGSVDFLKRADVAPSLTDLAWDLLVVDEAHGAAAPTDRHAALARVATLSRRVVIITATPYSGDAAAFASMAGLGAMAGEGAPLLFRRSRDDVGDARVRRHRFAMVRVAAPEARLQRLLDRYSREVWQAAPGDVDAARLAMTVLRKRALSSPAATVRSLSRRLELLRGAPSAPSQLSLFDDPPEPDDLLPDAVLAAPGLADGRLETRWLTTLVEAAERAVLCDSKRRYLLRLLARAAEPVVVFTEYRDTLRGLAEALPHALHLHGGLGAAERSAVQRRFNEHGGVLLATDAAAEGLNLQRRCRLVVNYELPWNPARLEQRIGRVDRIGQRRRVHAISLVARDTAEDLVVAALARRLVRVSATLGERDRLAALLTEARTARAVIGGGTVVPPGETPDVPPLPRPSPGDFPVEAIAAQVRAAAQAGEPGAIVAVSRIAPRPPMTGGAVAIVRAALVDDGGCVARRSFVVHVSETPGPISRDDDEEIARHAIETIARRSGTIDAVRAWFERASALQRRTVESRMARERALLAAAGAKTDLQPGLFDRRAANDHARAQERDRHRHDDHAEQLRRLGAALDVRLECSTAAVLAISR
jgi:superfamily II DNA or RNA helicase